MDPMKPMAPMQPMAPMKPMEPADASWWPDGLDHPSSSGGQNDLKYAFFPDQCRLAVKQGAKVSQYDTGDHRITGVCQSSGGAPRFSSQHGDVELASLKPVT